MGGILGCSVKTQADRTDVFGVYEGVGEHGWYIKGMMSESKRRFISQKGGNADN